MLTINLGTGGVYAFGNSAYSHLWVANETWVLEKDTTAFAGLTARNNVGDHWSIQPSTVMKLETYKEHLKKLSDRAIRYDRFKQTLSAEELGEATEKRAPELTLKAQCQHSDRATRFAYDAFARVVEDRTPIEGWDNNDYAYLAELASALENGILPLSALIWNEKAGWSKERAIATDAVAAHVAQEYERGRKSGDDDEQADINNDNGFLRAIFNLDDEKNPLVHAT